MAGTLSLRLIPEDASQVYEYSESMWTWGGTWWGKVEHMGRIAKGGWRIVEGVWRGRGERAAVKERWRSDEMKWRGVGGSTSMSVAVD